MEKSLLDFLKESGFSDRFVFDDIDRAFNLYSNSLSKWNRVINLISRKGPSIEHHLLDSLQYLKAVPKSGRFLDIGSGAGFPGVPLKIVLPNVQMELIESQRKRVNFLRSLITILKIKDIGIIHTRAEKLLQDPNYKEHFDVVLFRGVGASEYCLELGELFLKTGGVLILRKATGTFFPREFGSMELEKEILVKCLNKAFSKVLVFKKVPRETF